MTIADTKRLVPINKIIAAAMVDTYADINQAGLYQMYAHWACRGFRKLNSETLKIGQRKVLLTVNKNTHTATLPLDFYQESFVGVIDCYDRKVPLKLRTNLTDTQNIEEIACEDKCPKCAQNKNICKELTITTDTVIVIINGQTYEQTIIKTVYPNGDYFIETKTPVINITPDADEVRATASLQILHLGSTGAKAELTIAGVLIGEYVQKVTDTTLEIFAASIAAAFNGVHGFEFVANGDILTVTITAATGLGASINNSDNIQLKITQVTKPIGIGVQNPALAIGVIQFSGGVTASNGAGGAVTYVTQKEFVAKLDLKECGCLETTENNMDILKCNFFDTFCCYYAPCCQNTLDAGYQIFEETGLIKFANNFNFDKVYIEYQGFLPKTNGQYQVPEIAFETLVNWIKFKSVENRKNIALSERNWYWSRYTTERCNMEKVNGRFSFQFILQAVSMIPKFDYDIDCEPQVCLPAPKQVTPMVTDSCVTTSTVCAPTSSKTWTPFSILVVAGNGLGTPTQGTNIFQDDRFKNAIGINEIRIDNTTLTRVNNINQDVKDFTIDTVAGILKTYQGDGVTPRLWSLGEVLIVPTFFKLV